jgi:hypothetical protein
MFRLKNRPTWRIWTSGAIACALALVFRHLFHPAAGTFLAVNSFEVVDWMMQESLDLLVNKMAISAYYNTEVQKEFEHDFAPGETVRVKFPMEYLIRDGLTYTEQPINRRNTTVTCNQIFGIDFGWDSFELAVKMERGEEVLRREYLDPAMAQMTQEIESRCANYARYNTSLLVGALGTDPTTFDATSAASRQLLVNMGLPPGKDRAMIVNTNIMRNLKNSAISYFNPVTDIAKQFRTGIVGSGDGFDWYESVSLYQHTAGTWAGAVTVNGANQSGSTLAITCSSGDTFNQGDKFSIANVNPTNPRTRRKVGSTARTFTVLTAMTGIGGGNAADVLSVSPAIYGPGSNYQNVDALPATGAALTLFPGTTAPNGKTGTVNLAIHPDAFALVAVEFENPKKGSVEISEQLKDDDTGIPLAFLRVFDGVNRRWINRWDTCIGFGSLWSDNLVVAVLGA